MTKKHQFCILASYICVSCKNFAYSYICIVFYEHRLHVTLTVGINSTNFIYCEFHLIYYLWNILCSHLVEMLWLVKFILIWHCKRQRKFRYLELDLNSHFQVSRPPPLGLVTSLIQINCTKFFHDDLTFVFEDAQCFNSILEPSSEIWKTRFLFLSNPSLIQFKCTKY